MVKNIARGIMLFCALGAIAAFVSGVEHALSVSNDHKIVELWRLFGFLVFAAIFTLLALKPSQYPGIWEIAIFHKLAMTAAALFLIQDFESDAFFIAVIDGILAVLIIVAYFMSKSYTSWKVFGQKN